MRNYVCLLVFSAALAVRGADPVAEIKQVSAFSDFDLKQLAAGGVPTAANTSMKFDRGISAQVLYVARAPLAVAAELLKNWDPTKHPELEVFQHRNFHSEADANFEALRFDPKKAPVRKFIDLAEKKNGLLLTRAEASRASPHPDEARKFWAEVLKTRLHAFEKSGLAGLPACDSSREKIATRAEIDSLLGEEPRLAKRFAGVLHDLQASPPPAPAAYYWDIATVDNVAAVDFGATFEKEIDEHRQFAVVDLYVSNGYLTSLAFFEMWPVKIDGKEATLIWETTLVSSPELAGGFGVKRKIASGMVQRDLKKSAAFFQQDAAAAH